MIFSSQWTTRYCGTRFWFISVDIAFLFDDLARLPVLGGRSKTSRFPTKSIDYGRNDREVMICRQAFPASFLSWGFGLRYFWIAIFESAKKVTHDINNSPLVGKQLALRSDLELPNKQVLFVLLVWSFLFTQFNKIAQKNNLCIRNYSKANTKPKKKYLQKLGDYWQVFKCSMIIILPKTTLCMTDIMYTKTNLYRQEATR